MMQGGTTYRRAFCSSCNAPVIWGITSRDKKMPLDERPHADGVYHLAPGDARGPKIVKILPGETNYARARYVSHFRTCPHAERHSRRRAS